MVKLYGFSFKYCIIYIAHCSILYIESTDSLITPWKLDAQKVTYIVYTVVSRKYPPPPPPPPLSTLALVQNARGSLYTGYNNFARDYTLPSGKAWPHCQWGVGPSARHRQTQGREMLLTLLVGWRALALRGEEAGRFCKVTGMSIVDAGGSCLRKIH